MDTTVAGISEFDVDAYSPEELEIRVRSIVAATPETPRGKLIMHHRYLATIASLDAQLRAALLENEQLASDLVRSAKALEFEMAINESQVPKVKPPGRYMHCKKHKRLGYGKCPKCQAEEPLLDLTSTA